MKTIGVIGLGSIGMRHAKNLLAMGHKVYGLDVTNAAEDAAVKIGCSELPIGGYLLDECAGVIIATPTKYHYQELERLSFMAFGGGILCEKPLAYELNDNLSKILPDMMGNNQRYHPCVKQAKEWLQEGAISNVLYAGFRIEQYNEKYTDSVILNWGGHECDLALYLLGPATVSECKAKSKNGIENVATISLAHTSGANSYITMDYITKPQQRSFYIVGQGGKIHCDLEQFEATLETTRGVWEKVALAGSMDQTYVDEMQEFIRRIDGHESDGIGATGADGLRCLELLLEARRMASQP